MEYLPIDAEPPAFYLPGGRLVYQRSSSVWVAPYDLRRDVVGDPVELLSGVGDDEWAVSPSGVLAYLFARSRGGRVVTVDRQGRALVLVEEEREYDWPRIAPDGRRFAVGHDAPEGADLWIYELGSGRRLQLQAPGGNGEPTWTPDGRRVAYSTTRTEGGHLHWQLADGSGVSELLHAGTFALWPTSFSPDGRAIAFYGTDGEDREESIWIASLPADGRGETSARRVIGGPGTQRAGAFSPDGRWLAYSAASIPTGRRTVASSSTATVTPCTWSLSRRTPSRWSVLPGSSSGATSTSSRTAIRASTCSPTTSAF
jgi:Tol biopolymer transport system component